MDNKVFLWTSVGLLYWQ